jgi:hypothetical protein
MGVETMKHQKRYTLGPASGPCLELAESAPFGTPRHPRARWIVRRLPALLKRLLVHADRNVAS